MNNLADAEFSPHALVVMRRREISERDVRVVLMAPDRVIPMRPGRIVAQARAEARPGDRVYLLRVVVDIDESPPVVVTAYRTSRVEKYERRP